ncbi:unnamed protein product, partial [Rotaria magnacalcarata]
MNNNTISAPLVCFIVCDGGPAAHFAAFATNMFNQNQLQITIHATGPALNKLKDSNLPTGLQLRSFTIDESKREQQEQVARELIDSCLKEGARTIIVDIGNKFDALLQINSSKNNLNTDKVRFWCYYDNPEPYVPDQELNRLGINPSGIIGSLYNARNDELLEVRGMRIYCQFLQLPYTEQNPQIKSGPLEGKNSVSDVIGSDKELCLSIYLNLAAADGIPSLIKRTSIIDRYARYISYYYLTKQYQANIEQSNLKSNEVKKLLNSTAATHIVTEIKYGIHVIMIIKLCPDNESSFDELFKKLKTQLKNNTFEKVEYEETRARRDAGLSRQIP